MKKDAVIECNYHYSLRREWDTDAGQVAFVILDLSIRVARSYWDAHNNAACRGERDRQY